MKIERVEVRTLHVPLKTPFETSFGRWVNKESVLLSVYSEGLVGYAESTAPSDLLYNEECQETVRYVLREFMIPRILAADLSSPEDVTGLLSPIRRHYMAKGAIEGAVWDLFAKRDNKPLAEALGGKRKHIEVGVSVGIGTSLEEELDQIETFLSEGYRKIKVKIKPGFDVALLSAVRERFGAEVPLMADANSAYTLEDIPLFRELDEFGLMMIEQPLAHDDIIDHARLQQELRTPICLDESILSVDDARHALGLGSCRIINIKVGRVGGLTRARAIHDFCAQRNVPVWCGGMLELGIGRAHNIALASLPNFTIPGDTSPTKRLYAEDIITPPIDFLRPGVLAVPQASGIGHALREDAVRSFLQHTETFP